MPMIWIARDNYNARSTGPVKIFLAEPVPETTIFGHTIYDDIVCLVSLSLHVASNLGFPIPEVGKVMTHEIPNSKTG